MAWALVQRGARCSVGRTLSQHAQALKRSRARLKCRPRVCSLLGGNLFLLLARVSLQLLLTRGRWATHVLSGRSSPGPGTQPLIPACLVSLLSHPLHPALCVGPAFGQPSPVVTRVVRNQCRENRPPWLSGEIPLPHPCYRIHLACRQQESCRYWFSGERLPLTPPPSSFPPSAPLC